MDKIRRVIARGTLTPGPLGPYIHIEGVTSKVPGDFGVLGETEIEIVALTEPKLIRPPGAVWGESKLIDDEWHCWSNGVVERVVGCVGGTFLVIGNGCNYHTLRDAQQAAEGSLATNKLHGFRWETE